MWSAGWPKAGRITVLLAPCHSWPSCPSCPVASCCLCCQLSVCNFLLMPRTLVAAAAGDQGQLDKLQACLESLKPGSLDGGSWLEASRPQGITDPATEVAAQWLPSGRLPGLRCSPPAAACLAAQLPPWRCLRQA